MLLGNSNKGLALCLTSLDAFTRKMASLICYKKECIIQGVAAGTQLLMAALSKCEWFQCKSRKMTWPFSLLEQLPTG